MRVAPFSDAEAERPVETTTVTKPSAQLPSTLKKLATLRSRATARSERYSIDKFRKLDAYCSNVSVGRILFVLTALPLPGLFISVLPCFFPLQPVRQGPNTGLFLHLTCIVISSTFGLMLTWLEVTGIPRTKYSLTELVATTLLASVGYVVFFALFTTYVYYPVPFSSILGTGPLVTSIVIAHLVVIGKKLWTDAVFRTAKLSYGPSAILQVSQVVLYPAVSAVFDNVTVTWQVVLTLVFPVLKWILKRTLKKLSSQLKDFSTEVAVCGIEITASLYQSMIMQTSPSPFALVFIIGLDLVHGFFVVKLFLDRYSRSLPVTSRASSTDGTVILANTQHAIARHDLFPVARQILHTSRIESAQGYIEVHDRTSLTHSSEPIRLIMAESEKRRMIAITLETMCVAEEILLAEYFEVVVPIVNLLFMTVAVQLPSARFNTHLAQLASDRQLLATVTTSIVLYSALQGLTLAAMHWVMRYRYGISALSCLAFILERHALSITGKMMAWLPFILHFTIAQYGVDFTFRFEPNTIE